MSELQIEPSVPAAHVSPGLYDCPDDGAAYEVKFLMTDEQAADVERRLRADLTLDPNGDRALGDAYRVTSLYFETPQFHTYRRQATYRVQKYRIVGEDEADPKTGSISYVSPVARALMGKAVGDVVDASGQELEIIAIA